MLMHCTRLEDRNNLAAGIVRAGSRSQGKELKQDAKVPIVVAPTHNLSLDNERPFESGALNLCDIEPVMPSRSTPYNST
jgi:hypothetical protein